MLSFHRANPAFGQHVAAVAPSSSGYGQRQEGERDVAPIAPAVPVAGEAALPHCLSFLLTSVLLKKAKTDSLAKVCKPAPEPYPYPSPYPYPYPYPYPQP